MDSTETMENVQLGAVPTIKGDLCFQSVTGLPRSILSNLYCVPGVSILSRYFENAYRQGVIATLMELAFWYSIARYFFWSKQFSRPRPKMKDSDIDALVRDWTPEPVVGELSQLEREELALAVTVSGCVYYLSPFHIS